MKFTLGQAAKASGKSKTTIQRAIKSQRMSGDMVDGKYQIDPSELERVFGLLPQGDSRATVTEERHATPKSVSEIPPEMAKELVMLKEQVADLKVQRDSWQQQAERQVLLLEHQDRNRVGMLSRLRDWVIGTPKPPTQ